MIQVSNEADGKATQMESIIKGSKIKSNNMVMVVTGITETAFLGYFEYKGRSVGQCSILKEMFSNPHYMNGITIEN